MTVSKAPKATAVVATPTSQPTYQTTSRRQTPSQSYFSASPSPPPSTPPPPPPHTQINTVPIVSRAINAESIRRDYVQASLLQLDQLSAARSNGQPIPVFDASALEMHDFSQKSSSENPIERFCVWDWVDEANVIHARVAMAEIQKLQEPGLNSNPSS